MINTIHKFFFFVSIAPHSVYVYYLMSCFGVDIMGRRLTPEHFIVLLMWMST